MTITITGESAMKALEDCVDEMGREYVYEAEGADTEDSCAYIHNVKNEGFGSEFDTYSVTPDSVPGCLIGHALVKLGVPMKTFLDLGLNTGHDASEALLKLKQERIVDFPNEVQFQAVVSAYNRAQYRQDSGHGWGVALDVALSSYRNSILADQ